MASTKPISISRRLRTYQLKKQDLMKNKKSNTNRFLLSIIKKIVEKIFTKILESLLFSSIKDKLKDLFDFLNDSPIIDFDFLSIHHIKQVLLWLIELLNPLFN